MHYIHFSYGHRRRKNSKRDSALAEDSHRQSCLHNAGGILVVGHYLVSSSEASAGTIAVAVVAFVVPAVASEVPGIGHAESGSASEEAESGLALAVPVVVASEAAVP